MLVQLKKAETESCATGTCASVATTARVPEIQDGRVKRRIKDKLEKTLLRATGKAIRDFDMIEEGDRILVAMSGGKDSYVMMRMLTLLRERAPVKFQLVGVNIDQGYRGYRADIVEDWLRDNGYEHHIESTDIDQAVKAIIGPEGTACSLCGRMRRGVLYKLAGDLKCNKIALGHHRDDVIETLMLNLFFAGELKAMPLKLFADDGQNVVIRPLGYAHEEDIRAYAKLMEFPIIGCMCQHCGDVAMERQRVKAMLRDMEARCPGVKSSMLNALSNVKPTQLLDRKLMARLGTQGG
jgi:tRNA 2-thiocytidine biosynthesis protein TtcA